MADYNITSSDGTFTVNVQTGTINNQYDIPFIGQDAINYGDDLVAAQLRQLENFANTTPPAFGTTNVKGQLWYDSTPSTGRLHVFDGSSWANEIPFDIDVVHTTGAESIAGIKTFSSAPVFSAAGAPITVNSNTVVPNLNADLLDGLEASAFADAGQGLLADNAQPALPLNSTAGYVLSADDNNPNNYTWVSPAVSAGQVATNPTSTLDTTTNVLLVGDEAATAGGTVQDPLYASGLTYNAATSTLSTLNFVGTLSGTATSAGSATTATTADKATNIIINSNDGNSNEATLYPVLVSDNSPVQQLPHVDGGELSYSAASGQLNAAAFAGDGSLITAINLTSGTHTGVLPFTKGGTSTTTETGTGSNVRNDSPTFANQITVPNIAGSTVSIEGNNTAQIRTQDNTGSSVTTGASGPSGATTGAQVLINNGQWYDVGLNQMPIFNSNVSDTLEAGHCGTCQIKSTAGPFTLTLAAVGAIDFPVGGVTTVLNLGTSGDYVITEGASTTLWYNEPAVGGVDTAGGCTVGPGGTATIWRQQASVYYIWGSEITA